MPSDTDRNRRLEQRFEALDERIADLEERAARGDAEAFEPLLGEGLAVTHDLMAAYAEHAGKAIPVTDDVLAVLRAFVKGDPSLNAIRDNVRELVYYKNCLAMDRADALPRAPQRMVAHTARHIYLYLHSRAEQEHRLD
jgi:hypothetical protein